MTIAWKIDSFLSLTGLDSHRRPDGKPYHEELAEAAVDPRSGGAVAVRSKAWMDGKGGATKLLTKYWRMRPNGDQLMQDLIDINFTSRPHSMIEARNVWVLGRKVYDRDDEDFDYGTEAAAGTAANVGRVMAALKRINLDMRQGRLPEVAKIFAECHMDETTGERLQIVGLSKDGGFDFDITQQYSSKADKTLRIPSPIARAFVGLGVNTLDRHQRLGKGRSNSEIDPATGNGFNAKVEIADRGKGKPITASIDIKPFSSIREQPTDIPSLANIGLGAKKDGYRPVETLKILNTDLHDAELATKMRAIGTTNRILHDFRRRDYPVSMDHLTEFDLNDLVYTREPPPKLVDGGQLVIIPLGGNNFNQIANGYGTSIGGNCRLIIHEGLNENGEIDRVIVVQDIGLHLHPSGAPNLSATADLVPYMKDIRRILMTHRHLDHTDGKDIYVAEGYLNKGIVIDALPGCIRAMRKKMCNYPGITEDLWPIFNSIEDKGWIHVEKNGIRRISIGYTETLHSARSLAFGYVGRYGKKVSGIYVNHGDARFGRQNAQDYKGKISKREILDKDFFENFTANFLKEDPSVDPKIAQRRPTFFEIDATNILKKGWAPSEQDVEDNMVKLIKNLFPDKGILLAQISTNDSRFETCLRVASRLGRDFTEFGANVQDTAITMNVQGVSPKLVKVRKRQNIQAYLDYCFEKRSDRRISKARAKLKSEQDPIKRKPLSRAFKFEKRTRQYFERLKQIKQQARRYERRAEYEAALKQEFGKVCVLGSLRVSRTSETSKDIIAGAASRRFIVITGTQNSIAEMDSTLTRVVEGRSLFEANPDLRSTARTLDPSENTIFISQTAIPGNEQSQQSMIDRGTRMGYEIVSCIGDGTKIHNLPHERKDAALKFFTDLGHHPEAEASGAILVTTFPTHATGHDHENGAENWLKLVKADFSAAQHTSNPKATPRLGVLGRGHNLRVVEPQIVNFENILVHMGNSAEEAQVRRIGRLPSSLINLELVRKIGKYYGGYVKATRMVQVDHRGGLREDGLKASTRPDGFHHKQFATIDAEKNRKDAKRKVERPIPIDANRTPPLPERPTISPLRPNAETRVSLFPWPRRPQRKPAGLAA